MSFSQYFGVLLQYNMFTCLCLWTRAAFLSGTSKIRRAFSVQKRGDRKRVSRRAPSGLPGTASMGRRQTVHVKGNIDIFQLYRQHQQNKQ